MLTFDLLALDLRFGGEQPRGNLGNFWRGKLGAALLRVAGEAEYRRIFAPPRDLTAPSGMRDPVRPFVLRPRSADALTVHVFDLAHRTAEQIVEALAPLSATKREITVPLHPPPVHPQLLTVHFLSPTDLRSDAPDFATVFARARDRVSTLRSAYGTGPLPIDHKLMGEKAKSVRTVLTDVRTQAVFRRSRATGQVHSIGGITGRAVYEGDVAEFVPILEAAHFTGIGRKTVWGNGEIALTSS